MGLRTKFNLALLVACLIGMGAATFLSYRVATNSALEEIRREVDLLRSYSLAVRHYTVSGVSPLIEDEGEILFLPHTVPSFAAQTVFDRFREEFPDYYYKEAALNPTNPDDQAEPWEAELIHELRDNDDQESATRVIEQDGQRLYAMAFPITIQDESCLTCHSTPEVAPAAMLDLYGPENGFGWQLGETIGAQVLKVPMEVADKRAVETVVIMIVALAVAFLIVLLITNLLLSRIVIGPVVRMSGIAEKVSLGDFTTEEYVKPGRDEISSLSVSFNRMRRSLEKAMQMLE
ncbi:MAG: DUF3365 domain-containing protein [Rhodosalinus sp.]|uniref:Tll0287-like domain-containing protein n=1 Tax=Rhodosalinus sp. TaxID=2047741 RepID=UPI00397980BA